jgi:hypothetical protein
MLCHIGIEVRLALSLVFHNPHPESKSASAASTMVDLVTARTCHNGWRLRISLLLMLLQLSWSSKVLENLATAHSGAAIMNDHCQIPVAAPQPLLPSTTNSGESEYTAIYTWEEKVDSDDKSEATARVNQRPLWRWLRHVIQSPKSTGPTSTTTAAASRIVSPPHPLRTNLWELQCRWRGRVSVQQYSRFSTLVLDFDPSGYVRAKMGQNDNGDTNHTFDTAWKALGTWHLSPSGVTCHLPLPLSLASSMNGSAATTEEEQAMEQACCRLTMDFHANPFGRQAKFTRGLVFGAAPPSRSGWSRWPLRPVVATFTGRGIGTDTADLSYRQRQSSLSLP